MGKLKKLSRAQERMFIELISDKRVKQAADALNISFNTAQTHSAAIKKKTGATTLHTAVFRILHNSLIAKEKLEGVPITFKED